MTDLEKLIAAVEAGDASVLSGITLPPPPGYLTRDMARLCVQAFAGSLDAALRLHEALLPGWGWAAEEEDACVWHPDTRGISRDMATAPNPARAWLLAILRALKEKGQ